MKHKMKAWTDYPIEQLGDTPGEVAPIREVTILGYDGDKYVDVRVQGVEVTFKAGYLYSEPGRCGMVPKVDTRVMPLRPHWLWGMGTPDEMRTGRRWIKTLVQK